MQNQSAISVNSVPRSIAALLPAEVLDAVYSHFQFDYSLEAQLGSRIERFDNLNRSSLVAPAWSGCARRLFRSVTITSFDHLSEEVPRWVVEVRSMRSLKVALGGAILTKRQKELAPKLLCKLIQMLPSLRHISLSYFPFTSFDPADSLTLRSTVLLPHLEELRLQGEGQLHRIVQDLLATSSGRLSHLACSVKRLEDHPGGSTDLGGALRFLETNESFFRYLLRVDQGSLEGYRGLEESVLDSLATSDLDLRVTEFFAAVGTSLLKLSLNSTTIPIVTILPLCTRLTHLSLGSTIDYPALLENLLPATLSVLSLSDDYALHTFIELWTAKPSAVPPNLKEIKIHTVNIPETFLNLPEIDTFTTIYGTGVTRFTLHDYARQAVLATPRIRYKTLELSFRSDGDHNILDAEWACETLGLEFRLGVLASTF